MYLRPGNVRRRRPLRTRHPNRDVRGFRRCRPARSGFRADLGRRDGSTRARSDDCRLSRVRTIDAGLCTADPPALVRREPAKPRCPLRHAGRPAHRNRRAGRGCRRVRLALGWRQLPVEAATRSGHNPGGTCCANLPTQARHGLPGQFSAAAPVKLRHRVGQPRRHLARTNHPRRLPRWFRQHGSAVRRRASRHECALRRAYSPHDRGRRIAQALLGERAGQLTRARSTSSRTSTRCPNRRKTGCRS